ncbi:FAD-dependent oxidoreductase [Geobacter argillaceus]|uniref:Electron transfer flavoprotein-quinone oxidoreductase n=1 Tax=Geobacter argillaceus TaxID=345631 RepID=A0A562VMK5_9BACT|nr:FAD-dependent oxidoreductase [Geobacter argillaceus]TWJ19118.1 electron transfer flavoprotein-quinone oxidoreductase [Geobacter argillaceus]
MNRTYQAIVVGAGPAGSSAALTMARAGLDVALVERGTFPGEKNMFGGVLHRLPSLEEIFPDFWERAPLERHIVKKGVTFMTGDSSFNTIIEAGSFDRPPFNGYTIFRPRFDRWLAEEAVKAGVTLINRATVDDLVWKNDRVAGVSILDRGEISAPVVVAADGVLSFIAKKAGLRQPVFDPGQMAVGVKALIDMPRELIDERFGLVRDQGFANEFVGCTGGVRGGGFLYTNYDSVSVGLVFHLASLKTSNKTPYDLLNEFLEQPQVAKMVRGGRLLEYSAHVIPEGGYDMIPELVGDGILVAGDAAALCNATGLNLEGINLASQSGVLAGKAVVAAVEAGDVSRKGLEVYRRLMNDSYVIKDLKLYRKAPHMLHNDRIYNEYPELMTSFMEYIYRIEGAPKENLTKLFLKSAKEKVGLGNLMADAFSAWRSL